MQKYIYVHIQEFTHTFSAFACVFLLTQPTHLPPKPLSRSAVSQMVVNVKVLLCETELLLAGKMSMVSSNYNIPALI